MVQISSFLLVLLGGSQLISGLPTGQMQPGLPTGQQMQPSKSLANNATMDQSQNSTDSDDDDNDIAFVVTKEQISTAWLSDFIVDRMVDQCGSNADPAVQFFGCVENTTQLPAVWAAMGLNATIMRLRTVDSYTMRGQNITEDKNTFVTMIQTSDSQNDTTNTTVMDLFNAIGAQSDKLCMNVDGLMACLNPYLSACFPDSETSNDLNEAVRTQPRHRRSIVNSELKNKNELTNNSTDTDDDRGSSDEDSNDDSSATQAPDAESNDEDDDDDDESSQMFFMIPFLKTQSQIFPALQQSFSAVCSNKADALKGIIDNYPCLTESWNQAASSCEACDSLLMDSSSDDDDSNSTTPSSANKNSALDAPTCSALRDCAECQLDVAAQTCGQEVANNIQMILQIYFNALQCFPNAEGNNIRAPFNVHVL